MSLLAYIIHLPQRIEREKMEKNNETLSVLRHSCSHIMAQAVQKLFPQAKLAIGPSTDSGFYYDFDLTDGYAFTQEDLVKIEEEMKNIIKQNLTFERFEVKDVDAKDQLISKALALIQDDARLQNLHDNVLTLALPNSARIIAEEVMKLARR